MDAYIDLETSGLNPRYNQILSIGIIIAGEEHLIPVEHDSRKRVDPGALRVNGIDLARWRGYPLARAMELVRELVEEHRLIAHNAAFDAGFIAHAAYETETPIDNTWGCTLDWSRRIPTLVGIRRRTLASLHEHLTGTTPSNLHDALEDARSCRRIAQALRELDPEEAYLRLHGSVK